MLGFEALGVEPLAGEEMGAVEGGDSFWYSIGYAIGSLFSPCHKSEVTTAERIAFYGW